MRASSDWTLTSRERVISEVRRVLKSAGLVYVAAFAQTWEDPLYRRRYEDGLDKGYEEGTFEVIKPGTDQVEYVARHFTRYELEKLFTSTEFEIEYYSEEPFRTRTGNQIKGHVFLAEKRMKD